MQKEEIAAGVIQGTSQAKIAKSIGMSAMTVSRAINKDEDLNALILGNYKRLITNTLPKAAKNMDALVDDFPKPMPEKFTKADLQRKEHGMKATEYILNLGVSGSHTPSPVIQQNFFQNNNNQYIGPLTLNVLARYMTSIDAEVIEDPAE